MARYILFAGDTHYPKGGAYDLIAGYTDLGQAIAAGKALDRDWWHLLDTRTGDVYASEEQPDDPPPDAEKQRTLEALRKMLELRQQAHADAFNRRFTEAGPDEVSVRRCKHDGHQPIRDDRKRKRGTQVIVTCACGLRMFKQEAEGFVRIFDESALIKGDKR